MFKLFILVALLFLQALFGMNNKELAIAINLAGKQRMLTQKMSKEALLISLNVDKKLNKQKLKKSAELFNKTLYGLLYGDKELGLVPSNNDKVEKKLKEVEALWKPFYKRVKRVIKLKNPHKNDLIYIEQHNLKLLKVMNEAVFLYTQLGKNSSSNLKMANDINLAGKQRMLTQKIAKDILRYKNGINKYEALKSLNASRKLFSKTLDGLYNGNEELNLIGTKLPKIRAQLDKVKRLWSRADSLIPKVIKSKDKRLIYKLIKLLDMTKVEMNKAVELYTKSLNRQKQYLAINSIINNFLKKKNSNKHLINLAGKQRMLTQRISKLAIECSYNLREKSCQVLNKYTSLYQKTLNGFLYGDKELALTKTDRIDEIKKIKEIQKIWKPFEKSVNRVKATKGKDKKALKYILLHNEKLLEESNNLVLIFVKNRSKNVSYIEKSLLKIVNIAGRERMLTQKMTKEYLEYKLFKNKKSKDKIKKTMSLFETSLNNLIYGNSKKEMPKVTNLEIKQQLLKVKKIWTKLKPLYQKSMITNKKLKLLLQANPILLSQMNKAVYMIDNSTDY